MFKCCFRVDAPYANHLHVYPYYFARVVFREPRGTFDGKWSSYGVNSAGSLQLPNWRDATEKRLYEYCSSEWVNLPEWTLVSEDYSMYYPEPWEIIGRPETTDTGFVGYVPFYARLDQSFPGVSKALYLGYYGMAPVYNVPESLSGQEMEAMDLTPMITREYDPMIFASFTGMKGNNSTFDVRQTMFFTDYGYKPFNFKICVLDEDRNEVPGDQFWGTWKADDAKGTYGGITHLRVDSIEDWYVQHGDRISAYIQPLDPSGVPFPDRVVQDFFPHYGRNNTHSWQFIEHSQSGAMRIGFECMRIDLNAYGNTDLGFQVGVRLRKSDGTYVGLDGLKAVAYYDRAESCKLYPGLDQYHPWV